MHKVVGDTTPLLALLKINKLELLQQVYGTLYVPEAVFREIEKGIAKPYYVSLKTIPWIKIAQVKNFKAKQFFTDLDEGEAEVIILATEISADLVLMDETIGRRLARKAGLVCTGTIGVLTKAKELKLITAVVPLLLQLREKGIWIHSKLIETVKHKLNE